MEEKSIRQEGNWVSSDDEIATAVELNTIATFRSQFKHFRTKFHSFSEIISADRTQFSSFPDSSQVFIDRFLKYRDTLSIGKEFEKIPPSVQIITYFDNRYPQSLKELYDPPPVLYVKGNLEYDYSMSISVVGSRIFSDYGRQMSEMFAYQLGSIGFTIISGGARGIDSLAHKSAMDAGAKTIAVFGSGIDIVFPSENKKLFDQIAGTGALVTEFPMGTIPEKYNFPARNRIIAGLGRGTLVVEAGEKSGALITVDLALQMGREIFAIPGRITDMQSKGTNQAIRDGAHLAIDPTDVPLRFGLFVIEGQSKFSDTLDIKLEGDEAEIYELITLEPKEADFIVRETGISASRVLAALLMMQAKGIIRELPGGKYVRPVNRKPV